MINFDKIFGSLPAHKRTIIFEEGSWCIYRRESNDDKVKKWGDIGETNILHDCSKEYQEEGRNLDRLHTGGLVTAPQLKLGNSKCDRCDKIPPDHIQAMYLMLEWDR